MPRGNPFLSDDEFIELYNTKGPIHIARLTGLARRNVQQRRRRLAQRLGVDIKSPNGDGHGTPRIPGPQAKHRIELDIKDGHAIVFSDAHYWPSEGKSLMHRALVRMVKDLKPKIIIANGDVMDFPSISRHASIGWEKRPKVQEEIEFAQECLHEISLAAGRGVKKIWNLGNHCQRFETRIANLAPEFARVKGVHLRDHFDWEPAWTAFLNDSVLIKHRFKGGIHAVHNNLLWAGTHIITGHLHSSKVVALTYYNNRTIWGMDSGCLAEPASQAFVNYTEDNPKNWRSAFGVLTFRDGKLMQPELVLKWDEKHIQFRGEIIRV